MSFFATSSPIKARANAAILNEAARKAAQHLAAKGTALDSNDLIKELNLPVTPRGLTVALKRIQDLDSIPRGGKAHKSSRLWYHKRWQVLILNQRGSKTNVGAA